MKKMRIHTQLLAGVLALGSVPSLMGQAQPAAPANATPGAESSAQQTPSAAAPQVTRSNLVERASAPTESDMYCSGYITPKELPTVQHLVGGWETPFQSQFAQRDLVYLTGGTYEPGQKLQIVRHVKDRLGYEAFRGQQKEVAKLGETYQELGRVRVLSMEKNIAIATVEFSCDPFAPGDIVIPWPERPAPQFRAPTKFDRFAPDNGRLKGRIVQALEFDMIPGQRSRVYLNVGDNKGVKPGDYFRVTRTYESLRHEDIDSQTFKSPTEDLDAYKQPLFDEKQISQFPRRSVAELMVLYTTPTSSTAVVTSNIDAVNVGDMVEMEEEMPPAPPPPAAVMHPPSITCAANPPTVRVGDRSTITCTGSSEDGRPMTYSFATDSGNISSRENMGMLDTRNSQPGMVTVTATASDDRQLSASTATKVNVEAAPAPAQASRMSEFMFKPASAYVDNTAKAILDQVALRLQNEANSTVALAGSAAANEPARLSTTRANNAKAYLTRSKGIDAARVQTADAGKTGSRKVEVWFVPPGATAPTVTPK